MAQVALSIADYTSSASPKAKMDLAEILSGVLDNIQTGSISEQIKAKNGSGRPEAGVVEYKRFANATLNALGTARTAGKGVDVEDSPIKVNIDTDKEIVEEVAGKDLALYGVKDLASRRADNQAKRIKAFLDSTFFAKAKSEGSEVTVTSATTIQDKIDLVINAVKTTSTDFVDGVDTEDVVVVLTPAYFTALKNAMNLMPNGTQAGAGVIGIYNGVRVYESTRLGSGVNCIAMCDGAIAQPFYVDETQLEKIPLSNDYAIENFLHAGTKALVPETIKYC